MRKLPEFGALPLHFQLPSTVVVPGRLDNSPLVKSTQEPELPLPASHFWTVGLFRPPLVHIAFESIAKVEGLEPAQGDSVNAPAWLRLPDIVADGDWHKCIAKALFDLAAINTGAADNPPEISLRRTRAASADGTSCTRPSSGECLSCRYMIGTRCFLSYPCDELSLALKPSADRDRSHIGLPDRE